jgi:hypothetical protein
MIPSYTPFSSLFLRTPCRFVFLVLFSGVLLPFCVLFILFCFFLLPSFLSFRVSFFVFTEVTEVNPDVHSVRFLG